jgi:steroid delta-isomerase-like uncharacterized protein
MKTARDVIAAWVEATNAHDASALAALYHDDAQLLQVAFGELLTGPGPIQHAFDSFYHAFPDYTKEPLTLLVCDDQQWATLEWKGAGSFLGAFAEAEATGRSFTLRGCGVYHVVDGKIARHRRYFDRRSWYRQIGIP